MSPGSVPKCPWIVFIWVGLFQRVHRSVWGSNGSVPKSTDLSEEAMDLFQSVNGCILLKGSMDLFRSVHRPMQVSTDLIYSTEQWTCPKVFMDLFYSRKQWACHKMTLDFFHFCLFCFENAMAMFQRVHGVTPEREWPPALKKIYSFFCFEDTIALFKSVLGPFLLLFLFLFWGCNGPVPKCPWSYSRKSMTSSSSRCLACLWAQRCSMTEAEIRHFSWNICFLSAGQNLLAENKKTPGYSAEIISNLMNI